MHEKERVVGPILARALSVDVEVGHMNTDAFGTFSGEIPRRGSQLEAARAKARAGLALGTGATIALASEGSFGPHPKLPVVAGGIELVLLLDGEVELHGWDSTAETNYDHAVVTDVAEALDFAARVGAPTHAVLVRPTDEVTVEIDEIHKGLREPRDVADAVARILKAARGVRIESDMRAHVNPTRRKSIARATEALVRAALSLCPSCQRPGYVARRSLPGLPCSDCGESTSRPYAKLFRCDGCDREEVRKLQSPGEASPFYCPCCNP